MKFLLDTCVISEFAKPSPNSNVIDFFTKFAESDMFISAITLGELHRGVQKLSTGKKKSLLLIWLEGIENQFAGKTLSFCSACTVEWAKICVRAEKDGKRLSSLDSLIAAIASHNGMVLVTRNVKDFEDTGLEIIDPWTFSP